MYVVKCFVVTRVTEQAMIIVSDTLSDCISLIKLFDNYEWVFSVLQGHLWKSASYCINHAHALVMSIFSSIKPCITSHSSDMPHNMKLKKKALFKLQNPNLTCTSKSSSFNGTTQSTYYMHRSFIMSCIIKYYMHKSQFNKSWVRSPSFPKTSSNLEVHSKT